MEGRQKKAVFFGLLDNNPDFYSTECCLFRHNYTHFPPTILELKSVNSSLGFGKDLNVSHVEATNENQEQQKALLDKYLKQSAYAVDRAFNAYLGFRALGKTVDWLFPDTGSRPS